MKHTIHLAIVAIVLLGIFACAKEQESANDNHSSHVHNTDSESSMDSKKKPLSPRRTAMANIGKAHVHIDYSSPSVRGRIIWGGLIAYDQVWVTGAHSATSVEFSRDVKINGQLIPAGKYGFFTIPGKEEWTVILNKNYEQHLTDDYDQADDILRLAVAPKHLEDSVESLTYAIEPTSDQTGLISVSWDRVEVSIGVQVE